MSACTNPGVNRANGVPYRCGKCPPCIEAKHRDWAARIELEMMLHEWSSFVTLTYDDEHLPHDLSVSKATYRGFLKRLSRVRRELGLAPVAEGCWTFRNYGIGEYGDKYSRPHYHVIFFGMNFLDRREHAAIDKAWGLGFTHVRDAHDQSGAYVANYVAELAEYDKEAAQGRRPPFHAMTRGLGRGTAERFAKSSDWFLVDTFDVPTRFNVGGRRVRFDRYMRQKIRLARGMDHREPEAARAAREAARSHERAQLGPVEFARRQAYVREQGALKAERVLSRRRAKPGR